jgi:hypothetical protein
MDTSNDHGPGSRTHGLNRWEPWDGWIPTRDVMVERTSDDEVFVNATRDLGHRLRLGSTLARRPTSAWTN